MLKISTATIVEYNVITIIIAFILLLDVYTHLGNILDIQDAIKLDDRHFFGIQIYCGALRAIVLFVHIANAIFGIFSIKLQAIRVFSVHLLMLGLLMIYSLSFVLSIISSKDEFEFSTEAIINNLWLQNKLTGLEIHFDCCGKTGIEDYTLTDRLPDPITCCVLDQCRGCSNVFKLNMVEQKNEGLRDCAILFVMHVVGIVLLVWYMRGLPKHQYTHSEEVEKRDTVKED